MSTAREIILSLKDRFKPNKVEDELDIVFHFQLSGDNGGEFTVAIKDKNCEVSEGLIGEAKCTVKAKDKTSALQKICKDYNPTTLAFFNMVSSKNRLEILETPKNIGELLDKYQLNILPNKALRTQYDYSKYIVNVRKVFGHMLVQDIKPHHIYAYVDKRSKKKVNSKGKRVGGLTIAKREMAMFTDAYTYAVRLGIVDRHPFKNEVQYETEKARTRYIENWELNEFLSLEPKRQNDLSLVIHGYTAFKLVTGLRQ